MQTALWIVFGITACALGGAVVAVLVHRASSAGAANAAPVRSTGDRG